MSAPTMTDSIIPDSTIPDSILEAALHAFVAQRCERAYVHDLRNGLQSIYASVDVLTRMLGGKASPTLSHDKVAEMARKAINAYEQSLNQVAKRLIVQSDAPLAVNIDASLRELSAFLSNDATARGIALQAKVSGDSYVLVRPSKFRLTLLSIAVRIIDAVRNGDLIISSSTANDSVSIEFAARADEISADAVWTWSQSVTSLRDDWVLYATQKLIVQQGGRLYSSGGDGSREPTAPDTLGRVVQLRYPATTPSS